MVQNLRQRAESSSVFGSEDEMLYANFSPFSLLLQPQEASQSRETFQSRHGGVAKKATTKSRRRQWANLTDCRRAIFAPIHLHSRMFFRIFCSDSNPVKA